MFDTTGVHFIVFTTTSTGSLVPPDVLRYGISFLTAAKSNHTPPSVAIISSTSLHNGRSRWSRNLRRLSAAARLLGLRVPNPPGVWMPVLCECYVASGRSLCIGLIIYSEESYRVWYNLMFFWPCNMNWLYILITNLMHWLLFIHKILFSSTCFEPQVLIFRRIQLYTRSIWYCHSVWGFLVACQYTAWVRTDCRGKVAGRASLPYQQHCVNQMGKTHSKPLAARHGRGMAWTRHAMCKSALTVRWLSILSRQSNFNAYLLILRLLHTINEPVPVAARSKA